MAKEEKTPTLEERVKDMNQYQYAALAASTEDNDLKEGALEELAYSNFGDKVKGLIEGVVASEEGIKRATEVYSKMYLDRMNSMKISELYKAYESSLPGYMGGERLAATKKLLEPYGDETIGSIITKIGKAQYILKGNKDKLYEFTNEEKESAEKTVKKYANVLQAMNVLEGIKMNEIEPKAKKRISAKMARSLEEASKKQLEAGKAA